MFRPNSLVSAISLVVVLFVGACAEGTKLDIDVGVHVGGGKQARAGGTTGIGSGGGPIATRGGSLGVGGTSSRSQPSGGISSTTMALGGAVSTIAGNTAVSSGGTTLGSAGSSPATGGLAQSTVVAPDQGLGVLIEKQSVDGGNIKTNLVLVNSSAKTVDLTTIKLRYYFTMDGWSTPVLETYYAGPDVEKENIKSDFFAIALPGADRFVELSFVTATVNGTVVSPVVKGNGKLSIQLGLHDQRWAAPNASNDYSYSGAIVGYTDRITVFAGAALVWGLEPSASASGAGGATGGGGGVAGAGAIGMDRAGATSGGNGGVAGNATSGASGAPWAGAAGTLESAGAAGTS